MLKEIVDQDTELSPGDHTELMTFILSAILLALSRPDEDVKWVFEIAHAGWMADNSEVGAAVTTTEDGKHHLVFRPGN